MKIIIDINEHLYKIIKTLGLVVEDEDAVAVSEAIKNGTPLPEEHGRLIDADELRSNAIKHKYSNNFCEEHNIDWSINLGMLNILIADAPTIIEADKTESEE